MQAVRNRLRPVARSGTSTFAGLRGAILGRRLAKPSFLIIGTQKGGTTSLFSWMLQHPQIKGPLVKEVGFFDRDYDKGARYYSGFFPVAEPGASWICGEATPSYMFFPEVAQRVFDTLGPGVRLIALLRDPVARTLSHYFHERRLGYESLSLIDALKAEPERLASVAGLEVGDPKRDYVLRHFSYVARSRYEMCLKPWRDLFGDDRLMTIQSEIMFANPAKTTAEAFKFVSVEPFALEKVAAKNIGRYSQIDDDVRMWLAEALKTEQQKHSLA